MARADRTGKRKPRSELSTRLPDLGYYFVATDTDKTEKNYLDGLHDSLPAELQDRIVIKVRETETKDLIAACERATGIDPQYREPWIMFDRDQVNGFDEIIAEAEKKGIHAAWSNPCLEIWFDAYFGRMPTEIDSVSCCRSFAALLEKRTGRKYDKADKQIYAVLYEYGDEAKAIEIAERRLQKHLGDDKRRPSEMCPCTTVHKLIAEIRMKTSR